MSLAKTTERGYGTAHQRERARWQRKLDSGLVIECARAVIGECKHPEDLIDATTRWDLGHSDDRTEWTGPEHVDCNRRAGGANGNRERARRNETLHLTWG